MITTIRPQQSSPSDAKPDAKPLLNEHVLLRGITWETFQSLMVELESQPSKRLTYDNGLLEIWMPLAVHERYKKFLARLVEVVTLESEIEMCSLGSCTWSRKDLLKGVEADECYYIQHEAMIRGKMAIDLTIDPPPDLAIEVDVTSLSLPRLPIYGALGVPEVWRVYEGMVQILVLQDGDYGMVDRSLSLPLMTTVILQGFLDQAPLMGETSWAKMVQQWVRDSHDSDL